MFQWQVQIHSNGVQMCFGLFCQNVATQQKQSQEMILHNDVKCTMILFSCGNCVLENVAKQEKLVVHCAHKLILMKNGIAQFENVLISEAITLHSQTIKCENTNFAVMCGFLWQNTIFGIA